MRRVIAFGLGGIALITAASIFGQQPPAQPPPAQPTPVIPAVAIKQAPAAETSAHDLAKMTPLQRAAFGGTKSGLAWLMRVNKPDGRFVPGFEPALRAPLEADSYLHQTGAAWALAQGASFFKDERAAMLAKQALLTLLVETTTDSKTHARCTVAPDGLLNRLASGGMLAVAIFAAPAPAADLVQQADQLVHYLRLEQQADGSFTLPADDPRVHAETLQHATGWALHALARSHAVRPEPWKLEAIRKGAAHYHAWWRQHKSLPMIPAHTAAYADAFAATKEKLFADAVFEMNDWLCDLQYVARDPRRPHWLGGFQTWTDGKAAASSPDIRSADAARSLAHAYRVAKEAGAASRAARYKSALEGAVQFLGTLQYTEANTQHFTQWYRQNLLLGGFFVSHQSGTLRLEATAQAVAALVPYLQHAVE
jgi:hypothetical protein